jgi:hypothetical protein
MAPRTKVPDKNTLERWRDEGYTQAQMVELTLSEFGEVVSRSAIANAMARYGLSAVGPRYDEEVPWQINATHATAHPLRMLRLLGRRNATDDLGEEESRQLDSWLQQLDERQLIVGYDPDDTMGFRYINISYKDHELDIPIRRRLLYMAAPKARRA